MYIFGTVISVVVVMFALLLNVAMTNVHSSNAAIGDPVAFGFMAYETAYQAFMAQYGSVVRGIYPQSNDDLFPAFGFAPNAPMGGVWQFGVDKSNGGATPYACFTITVNSSTILNAMKDATYGQGGSVVMGSSCTSTIKISGNLLEGDFPVTISAVKHYSGKSTKTIGAN